MGNLKRMISLLVVLSLLLGVFNLSVFAESPSAAPDSINTTIEGSVEFPEVQKVLDLSITSSAGETTDLKLYLTTNSEQINEDSLKSSLPSNFTISKFVVRDLTPEEIQEVNSFEYFEGVRFDDGVINPQVVDTIFDIGSLVISLWEFLTNPTFWNGFNVVVDGAAVIIPGVPSINGVKRMMEASPTLTESLKIGIMSYRDMNNRNKVTIPTGWERHHIFEKRFAKNLGVSNHYDMLSIALPAPVHYQFTELMRTKYAHNKDWSHLSKEQVLNAHINAYTQLFKQTNDPVWEFLAEFSRHRQVVAKPRKQQ